MKESGIARSIKARLLNLADGNNKRYQQLIVRFLHERFLYRLAKSTYRERFILKGGALLYAFEEFMPRPTLDIDFMGTRIDNDKKIILSTFRAIAQIAVPDDGITFQCATMTAEDITLEKKYPGVRICITANIGSYRQNLTFDVGFGDIIVPFPIHLDYPVLLNNMEEPGVLAYSLETVVAEKFQTMIDRGRFNSRMKDYFDLYRIFSVHTFDGSLLIEAIKATFENRSTSYTEDYDFFASDFGEDIMLNRQWNNFIRKMNLELPQFKDVHSAIVDFLLPHWLKIKRD